MNKSAQLPYTHSGMYKGRKNRMVDYKQIRGLADGIIVKDISNERSKIAQCPYRKSSRVMFWRRVNHIGSRFKSNRGLDN